MKIGVLVRVTLEVISNSEVKRAYMLVKKYHKEQVDLQGKKYIWHPLRVMVNVQEEKGLRAAALLHDILEDTPCTREILLKSGISEKNVKRVEILTRHSQEKYFDYIQRVKQYEDCAIIKRADIKDNLREGCPETLKKRYEKALELLEN